MKATKIRIDIAPDNGRLGPRGGRTYMINRWVFERKTGRTVDFQMGIYRGMTLKQARTRKREIMEESNDSR